MYERPGRLTDYLPKPYPNEETARYANNGALPPDLSLQAKARHFGDVYIFSLLTGYKNPPAGVELRDGQYYNPYFVGGSLSMAPPLAPGIVEYEDGTEASVPQMAKDVACFLCWAANPELDERKTSGIKLITLLTLATLTAGWWKRFRWMSYKSRRLIFTK
uniref:Cytochrome c1, heme protein, mitochondrial n=2 Tax=Lygus hesperus TaxID=30085 RepID=A0A146LHZ9_LYGHE